MDNKEFEELCEKHRRALLAYVYTCCRNTALAEDIVQEALLIAYNKREQYFPEANFGGWLIAIARNVWFRERDKLVKRGEQVPLNEAIDANASMLFTSSLYDDDAFEARRNALAACLGRLGGPDREILDLYFTRRRRYAQIAEMMNRTLSWVKVRMSRVRAQLLHCMKKSMEAAEAEGVS
jgi:RNA polymerase sigma-70 factor (ECF subfamily)